MEQLSLVFFTVLAQCAVGIFLVTGSMRLFTGSEKPGSVVAINQAQLFVWPVLAIAAIASMTHLGQPLRAFNILFGVGHSSPLSLEIMSMGAFGASGVAYSLLSFQNKAGLIHKPLLALGMVLGVVFLLAISHVYTLETVPTWNSGWTMFQFLATAGVLGVTGTAVVAQLTNVPAKHIGHRMLPVLGVITSIIVMVGVPMFLMFLGQLHWFDNALGLRDYHSHLLLLRTALLCIGMALWVIPALRGQTSKGMTITGLLLVLMAELAGRAFFYDVYLTTGM